MLLKEIEEHNQDQDQDHLPKFRKFKLIKKLNEHSEEKKIKTFLDTLNLSHSESKEDYFINPDFISYGKISPKTTSKPFTIITQSNVTSSGPRKNQRTNFRTYSNSVDYLSNNILEFNKNNNKRQDKKDQNKNFHLNIKEIDNKDLMKLYDKIKKRINDPKTKAEEEKKFLKNLPKPICTSLQEQQSVFEKTQQNEKYLSSIKEKILLNNRKKIMTMKNNPKKLKITTKCESMKNFLINNSRNYQNRIHELGIVDKNVNNEVRHGTNLWKITLRNRVINGKFEEKGFFKLGGIDKDPLYTIFNVSPNMEFINLPKANESLSPTDIKKHNRVLFSFDENRHSIKTKQDLQRFNNIYGLEVKGKNLINLEEEKERQSNSKKVLLSRKNLEESNYKREAKIKKDQCNFEKLFDNRTFAENFNRRDYFKNIYLHTKCSSSHNNNYII